LLETGFTVILNCYLQISLEANTIWLTFDERETESNLIITS